MKRFLSTLVLLSGFLLPFAGVAAGGVDEVGPPEQTVLTILEIIVVGNSRVETAAIDVYVGLAVGEPLDEKQVDADIKEIYSMGLFDQVWVSAEDSADGIRVAYHVTERPYVTELTFEGVDKVVVEDLEAVIGVVARSIFDPQKAWEGLEQARKLYSSEGYPDADVDYELTAGPDNTATIAYTVVEGELIRIEDIRFEGVRAFKTRKLRKLMTTRKAWFLSWITGAGLLNEDELATDVERIGAFYYDEGYIQVRVDEPLVEREGDGLVVILRVEEGPRFEIGSVRFEGDMFLGEEVLLRVAGLHEGEVFKASELRQSVFDLTEAYGNLGYAFANITPQTRSSRTEPRVDIVFRFESGPVVSVRRIEIRGNTKTREHVVRRELEIQEGQKFSGTGLTDSKDAVRRTGFFDTVDLSTSRTEKEDEVDLLVEVKEGRTGSFSAGAGFSSADSLLFNARIAERNLFGRGQSLVLNTDVGSIRQNFQFSFTEPWFGGYPLSLGFDIFDWQVQFDRFTRGGTGLSLRASYPLRNLGISSPAWLSLERIRAGIEYRLEEAEIDGVRRAAPASVKAEEGKRLTSSIKPTLVRNTVDHPFNPTRGSRQVLSAEFAGLGGNSEFVKLELSGRWFRPVWETKAGTKLVYSIGARLAFGVGDSGASGEELPLFERYFPGGIGSVRGFDDRSLGPTEEFREDDGLRYVSESVGGSQQLILNNELIFPIFPEAGLNAVAFFDAGNAFTVADGIDLGKLRYAVGWGIRWLSPMGPLRIEVGYPLDPEVGESSSVVSFSFGAPF